VDGLTGLVVLALSEDVGSGDVTTGATVPEDALARAKIVQKAPGTIYGFEVTEAVLAQLDPDASCERLVQEGIWREDGGPVMVVEGRARALLM
jgi:nicotinate-nucleotide pyrophosphorylase (carboxylating)